MKNNDNSLRFDKPSLDKTRNPDLAGYPVIKVFSAGRYIGVRDSHGTTALRRITQQMVNETKVPYQAGMLVLFEIA